MKAARIQSFGPADALRIIETDMPVLARPCDLLVRVVASGVNAIEWKIRSGATGRTPSTCSSMPPSSPSSRGRCRSNKPRPYR
ncbi:hypothetical protein [Candidatus Accumulibacter sp. ACC007]|uniref:hypothetical protein n=1 Tax=Candidatus Accumulibacter sp. ACC007 TaxID=2823333 RepID=UPI0025C3C3AB|nr:hypothetical protein [Candidatus Accumulibacter sp. ACC007]